MVSDRVQGTPLSDQQIASYVGQMRAAAYIMSRRLDPTLFFRHLESEVFQPAPHRKRIELDIDLDVFNTVMRQLAEDYGPPPLRRGAPPEPRPQRMRQPPRPPRERDNRSKSA